MEQQELELVSNSNSKETTMENKISVKSAKTRNPSTNALAALFAHIAFPVSSPTSSEGDSDCGVKVSLWLSRKNMGIFAFLGILI